jgi:DNA replication protein DnaC
MMEGYGKRFDIDQDNREILEQIAYYFAEDPRFTGDHMKGVLLYGAVGVGKSELMRFFSRNQKQSFILVPCRHVEVAYAKDGDEGVGIHCTVRIRGAGATDPYGHRELGTCFDDLGTEPIVTKYYGTDKSVMTEVILNRYDMQMDFRQTHITTNLSADQLRERYGTRATDRMREMFNFISWKSTRSRRGKDSTPNP